MILPCRRPASQISQICGLVSKSHSKTSPFGRTFLSTKASRSLRRSYLYVPSSSEKMLEKSTKTGSDVITYDLEDSVSPLSEDKSSARTRLKRFLTANTEVLKPLNVAVRVNGVTTPFFHDDISQIVSQGIVTSLILPKIHSIEELDVVAKAVSESRSHDTPPVEIIPSIESAKGMFNLGSIAGWKSAHGPQGGELGAILFAAEDYCADTSIIRTSSRRELLYTRSQIVITAKAFGLDAIDMVCVNYKNLDTLKEESLEGRQLGFTGKQAIHPSQVEIIKNTFVPSKEEITLAAKILHAMKEAHASQIGAVGLDGVMIDAPMIRQAEAVIDVAKSAGLEIPSVI